MLAASLSLYQHRAFPYFAASTIFTKAVMFSSPAMAFMRS
jgi:hypothetical protein